LTHVLRYFSWGDELLAIGATLLGKPWEGVPFSVTGIGRASAGFELLVAILTAASSPLTLSGIGSGKKYSEDRRFLVLAERTSGGHQVS